ncbi:hypothetical protein [uncultured Jatrophihabitans sp.]|uniref:hypothetical protein n=1 Tax=uncultured Jatrophihabitans sp. TaxID=1610747 RepID=UPI0035CB4652
MLVDFARRTGFAELAKSNFAVGEVLLTPILPPGVIRRRSLGVDDPEGVVLKINGAPAFVGPRKLLPFVATPVFPPSCQAVVPAAASALDGRDSTTPNAAAVIPPVSNSRRGNRRSTSADSPEPTAGKGIGRRADISHFSLSDEQRAVEHGYRTRPKHRFSGVYRALARRHGNTGNASIVSPSTCAA